MISYNIPGLKSWIFSVRAPYYLYQQGHPDYFGSYSLITTQLQIYYQHAALFVAQRLPQVYLSLQR